MGNSLNTAKIHDALMPLQQIASAESSKSILRPFKDKDMEFGIAIAQVETLTKKHDTLEPTKIMEAFQRGQSTSINALEFLTAVALFSKGSVSDCFGALFGAFDFRDEKTITTDELCILVVSVFRALRVAFRAESGGSAIGELDDEYCEGEVEKWFPAPADGSEKKVSVEEIVAKVPELLEKDDLTVMEICERFKVSCSVKDPEDASAPEPVAAPAEEEATSESPKDAAAAAPAEEEAAAAPAEEEEAAAAPAEEEAAAAPAEEEAAAAPAEEEAAAAPPAEEEAAAPAEEEAAAAPPAEEEAAAAAAPPAEEEAAAAPAEEEAAAAPAEEEAAAAPAEEEAAAAPAEEEAAAAPAEEEAAAE